MTWALEFHAWRGFGRDTTTPLIWTGWRLGFVTVLVLRGLLSERLRKLNFLLTVARDRAGLR